MQCKEWDDANSELFKESHDEAVHKNSYKSKLYELISASLNPLAQYTITYHRMSTERRARLYREKAARYSFFPAEGILV